ncbi:MAG: hypothetical protein COT84_01055 [Chlamydiae bacterium CG10_big_fil_rev_8_21_14_0_10_35_9]|nr:MAG: hypothetical protein COT84_01055 [Chlamydiae bacterium CG10_big_fil_rev_8_21_14_0_10_35_9]
MKKFLAVILIIIFVLVTAIFLSWIYRTSLTAYFISKQLNGVPVNIESMEFSKDNLKVRNLFIGNPPQSKTATALESQLIDVDATLQELRGKRLTIEGITVDNSLLAIEFYNQSGTENNWSYMLNGDDEKEKDTNGKEYLIKRLTLKNLTVQVTKMDGSVTRYPTLEKLEFYNISNETGFPIKDIEKAIFNTVLKSIFQRFGLDNLLKSLDPAEWVPGILPFFGKEESEKTDEKSVANL